MSDDAPKFIRWEAPPVKRLGNPGAGGSPDNPNLTSHQQDSLQQQAYDEAFTRGLEDGRRAGTDEIAARVAQLDALLCDLAEPFEQLDDEVEAALVNLSINIARQIIRRELRTDPSEIVGVVREAIKVLPVSARDVRVQLHPEDAAVVRRALQRNIDELPWKLVEDPLLTRGGARVCTETAQIDARVESRLGAILAALLEGDRHDDG